MGFAERQLKVHGEFHPFAAYIGLDGVRSPLDVFEGEEFPDSQQRIGTLTAALSSKAAAGEIRASGVCFDATIRPANSGPTDAVKTVLEHQDGRAVECFLPYSKGDAGAIEFGEVFAQAAAPSVFA